VALSNLKNLPTLLILALFVVGCAEYSSYNDCMVKETAKLKFKPDKLQERRLSVYCLENS
tara:strand:+ start:1565 stop:1744 length:180 start_codon:yes stop_codon:yes gene_type:complete